MLTFSSWQMFLVCDGQMVYAAVPTSRAPDNYVDYRFLPTLQSWNELREAGESGGDRLLA